MKYILFLSLLSFTSFAQLSTQDLPGTWKIVHFAGEDPYASEQLMRAAEAEALTTSYTFNAEGTFTITSQAISESVLETYLEGTWEIKGDSLILSYTSTDEPVAGYKIVKVDTDVIRLSQSFQDDMGRSQYSYVLKREG